MKNLARVAVQMGNVELSATPCPAEVRSCPTFMIISWTEKSAPSTSSGFTSCLAIARDSLLTARVCERDDAS